ncbi:MAG: DNA-methyltransferase [Frankiaceae bacterium]
MSGAPRNTILIGDALTRLRALPTASVDCVVTSPPYYQLRDYGVTGQLGLEANVDDWAEALRLVLAEVGRVLAPTGSLWLNLADSFSRHPRYGASAKSLLLAPERMLLALAEDGWLVRNKVVWAKPNPMPNPVRDRLTLTYEVVYLLVRGPRYFFDLDAIRAPVGKPVERMHARHASWAAPLASDRDWLKRPGADRSGHPLGKNPGDVWTIPPQPFRGAHFATFPEALVRRPLLATCPEAVCTACRQPWRRRPSAVAQPGPLKPCGCDAPAVPGLVLDPFFGTGTVGVVATQLGRDWLGIEPSPAYAELARQRLGHNSTEPMRAAA